MDPPPVSVNDSSAGPDSSQRQQPLLERSSAFWTIEPVRCRPWAEGEPLEERVTVSSETRSSTMLSRSKACLWITFYLHVWWCVRGGGAQNAKDGKFGKFGLSRPSRSNSGPTVLRNDPCLRSDCVRTFIYFCFLFFYSGVFMDRTKVLERGRRVRR